MEKLKSIKTPRSMTLDNLTPEAKEYVDYLKSKFKVRLEKWPYLNNTWSLLRFLRARDFNIKNTEKMLDDALTFFETTDFDRIRHKKFPIGLREVYFRGFYNVTKDGHPVLIERVAMTNPKKCFELMSEEDIKDYFIRDLCFIYNIMLPICSEKAGKRIDKVTMIFDLEKVNVLTFFDSNVKKLIKLTSKVS